MNLPSFDSQCLINGQIQSYSKIEESKRLADELRQDNRLHVETCELRDIVFYLRTHPRISQAKRTFLYRIVAVRFSTDYRIMKELGQLSPIETEMIASEARNDQAWFGEVGFQNCVRLDKSTSIPELKVVKRKNDCIKVMRK